ncbi:MAG: WbqC family protein, partial [Flavobacteriaceae bacterium]
EYSNDLILKSLYFTRQVFQNKFGFIENLSILDLLFNLGPNTLDYLKKQALEY